MNQANQTVHLIAEGTVPAIAYGDVKIGNVLMFNYGVTSTVIDIEEKSACFVTATVRASDGAVTKYSKRKTTLIGIV